ncbi:pyridoxal-phosphate dependent enzyme [Cryobacterium sp. Y11]|uniref:pyridoxal-phosphate dependent enzyme n=1 Tax=Cryobacterium sp. Y11 TaxID=2045016 RepID=UPI0011B0BF30|nr:pyridoxal-phosphate dependent enzyme [Cryobacterium sp. Y11]
MQRKPAGRAASVLRVLAADLPVLVKLEGRNLAGSAKDRVAFNITDQGEASGALAPGATIVESSSGNTGNRLTLVGRLTGHPVVIVHTDQISAKKTRAARTVGAKSAFDRARRPSRAAALRFRARCLVCIFHNRYVQDCQLKVSSASPTDSTRLRNSRYPIDSQSPSRSNCGS